MIKELKQNNSDVVLVLQDALTLAKEGLISEVFVAMNNNKKQAWTFSKATNSSFIYLSGVLFHMLVHASDIQYKNDILVK